ncbi:hypothetical protein K4F52_003240 [Lecanicillium sp. MT-2017a]|nr:hypothetical protein K4F52_003240 [Lecanicillium sp. MT-2017a]
MAAEPGPSKALVRKRQDTELMPPAPPVKKIRRPKQVLDEDSYTEALSQIIARDFFPGLLESQTQQEYLDAVDSKDAAWISSASRRLRQVMTPCRRTRASNFQRPMNGGQTPMTFVGDTPATVASQAEAEPPKPEANMSLSKFQETYTSEDNESFYKLVDKQNQKRADKYAWLWRGNKLPSKQMIAQKQVTDKLEGAGKLIDDGYMKKDRLAIKDSDDRPARPDSWKSAPKNGFMYMPNDLDEGLTTVAQASEDASRMGPKAVVYANTRVPQPHVPKRPTSPTLSSVRDAVAGRPRPQDRDSSVAGGETPRVNGYAFVDDEDDDSEPAQEEPVINLGPGDSNNPFKLQKQRKRESLHERMVDRISRSKKESSRHGFTGRVEQTPVPKFPSSPRVSGNLTPAAQRLWSSMGTPKGKTPGDSFGQPTPMRARGSLLKNLSKPGSKSSGNGK